MPSSKDEISKEQKKAFAKQFKIPQHEVDPRSHNPIKTPFKVASHQDRKDAGYVGFVAEPKVRKIGLDNLQAGQHTIDKNKLASMKTAEKLPGHAKVAKVGDKHVILDEHHRLAAALSRGDTHAKVKVLEADEALKNLREKQKSYGSGHDMSHHGEGKPHSGEK